MSFAARFGQTNRLSPGKIIGVTVRLYAHKSEYNTVVIKRENIHARHWTADNISLFYSPHKFPQLFHTVVYMHLRANGRAAARLIAFVIYRLDLISSEVPKIVHWNLGSCIFQNKCHTSHNSRRHRHQWCIQITTNTSAFVLIQIYTQLWQYTNLPWDAWQAKAIRILPGSIWLREYFKCKDLQSSFDEYRDVNNLASTQLLVSVESVITIEQKNIYPNNEPLANKKLKCDQQEKRLFTQVIFKSVIVDTGCVSITNVCETLSIFRQCRKKDTILQLLISIK